MKKLLINSFFVFLYLLPTYIFAQQFNYVQQHYDSLSVLDSVIITDEWGYATTYAYNYNSFGDVQNVITENSRTNFEYNKSHFKTLELNEKWTDNSWVYTSKKEYRYNSSNKLINTTSYTWTNDEWLPKWRDINEYDISDNKIHEYYENYSDGNWNTSGYPHYYSYDEENRLIFESYKYVYDVEGQVAERRITYTYNIDSTILLEQSEASYDQDPWMNEYQKIYMYYNNGKLNNIIHKNWNGINDWINAGRDIYEYNSDGKIIFWIQQHWDSSWVNLRRELIYYDIEGNKISEYWERWDGAKWFYSFYDSRVLYNFDSNNNCIYGKFALWIDDKWNARKGGLEFHDSFGHFFSYYAFELNAFYKPFNVTKVINNVLKNFNNYKLEQNYPNPFNPITNISYSIPKSEFVSLKVYNILGKEISELVGKKQNAGYYNIRFDGTNLSCGIYLYRLQSGDYINTKKLMLIK